MNRLRWFLRITAARLGREGMLGMGLLLLCIGVYIGLLLPSQARINQLQGLLDARSSTRHDETKNSPTQNASLTERLATYYSFFPPQTSAPDWLDKIYNDAKAQNLALIEGKYNPLHERAGRLIRYEINLPVTGNFQQIYKFIGKVLNDIPYVALNGISYDRRKIGDVSIKAKIKFYLYLGPVS